MGLLLLLTVLFVLLLLWRLLSGHLWALTAGGTRSGNSPFRRVFLPSAAPPSRLVTDQRERDRVLKQSFSVDKIPDSLDAIIIGESTIRAKPVAHVCHLLFTECVFIFLSLSLSLR